MEGILCEPHQWRAGAALWAPLPYSLEGNGDTRVINWKIFRMKWSWPNFKLVARQYPGGTEEYNENTQSGEVVSGPKFEPGTLGIRNRSLNHLTTNSVILSLLSRYIIRQLLEPSSNQSPSCMSIWRPGSKSGLTYNSDNLEYKKNVISLSPFILYGSRLKLKQTVVLKFVSFRIFQSGISAIMLNFISVFLSLISSMLLQCFHKHIHVFQIQLWICYGITCANRASEGSEQRSWQQKLKHLHFKVRLHLLGGYVKCQSRQPVFTYPLLRLVFCQILFMRKHKHSVHDVLSGWFRISCQRGVVTVIATSSCDFNICIKIRIPL
jgi:hypothetical protein